MIGKSFVVTDGPGAGTSEDGIVAGFNLAAGATLAVGTPLLRDVTQLPGGLIPADVPPTRVFLNSTVSDRGVLATNANGGDILGIYQGPNNNIATPYTNTTGASQIYSAYLRKIGLGRVLAGAVSGGTAVTVGSRLIVTNANIFATVGAPVIGFNVGRVIAYAINTTIVNSTIAPGSATVTPVSMAGINVGSSLRIDTGTVQETVVVTAVTATTFTAVFASSHSGTIAVQGITSAQGASILTVPGTGSNSGIVFVDINVLA